MSTNVNNHAFLYMTAKLKNARFFVMGLIGARGRFSLGSLSLQSGSGMVFHIGGNIRFSQVLRVLIVVLYRRKWQVLTGFRLCAVLPVFAPAFLLHTAENAPKTPVERFCTSGVQWGAICATNATHKEYGANSGIVAAHAPLKRKIPLFGGSIVNVGGSNCPVNSSGVGEPAVNRGAGNIVGHAELCDSAVNITLVERFRRADKVHGFHGFDDPRLFHSP